MRCSAGSVPWRAIEPRNRPGQLAFGGLQIGDDAAFVEMLFDEVMHVGRFDGAVDHRFGIDDHQRQRIAAAQIAHHHHRDFILQAELFDLAAPTADRLPRLRVPSTPDRLTPAPLIGSFSCLCQSYCKDVKTLSFSNCSFAPSQF